MGLAVHESSHTLPQLQKYTTLDCLLISGLLAIGSRLVNVNQCQSEFFSVAKVAELLQSPHDLARATLYRHDSTVHDSTV